MGSAASVSRTSSVSIQVGCALATVTPRWATSSRSASPNRSSPALAGQYALMPGRTVNAAAELCQWTREPTTMTRDGLLTLLRDVLDRLARR